MSELYTDEDVNSVIDDCTGDGVWCTTHAHHWPSYMARCKLATDEVDLVVRTLELVAPAIAARAKAEAWDEGAEATAEWMCNNPWPSGIPHDPPRNPYAEESE